MSKRNTFNHKKSIPRYMLIIITMGIIGIAILCKAAYIMTAKKSYWTTVASRLKKDSIDIKPNRGNILSADGQLLSSTLPEYKIYMDFQALKDAKNDTIFKDSIEYIAAGLHRLFPEKNANAFAIELKKGLENNNRHLILINKRIDYNTLKEVQQLPIFKLGKNRSGFHWVEFSARKKPFGNLALRTIGELYGEKDAPKFGLELYFDSALRGINGMQKRQKVLNKYLNITEIPPQHGADIITTIDINFQDLAERAVLNELYKINGNVGVAILMEVKTGDIKAIVNLEKTSNRTYAERRNRAVSDLLEPGSVFKTASLMVALDDGYIDTNKVVETGNGQYDFYGRTMKDHNWRKGGYGRLSLPEILMVSSNIGVSRIVDQYYKSQKEKFVDGIRRLGLADDLHIPIPGSTKAKIKYPTKNKHGQYINWSATTLPWMSIGYESQVPPISTLAFYNAIANNGTMMQPRLVKQIVKEGKVVKDFPPQVLRKQIAKEKTIAEMQKILTKVVTEGLGKKAGSDKFLVAGKTGTAQISKGTQGYTSGAIDYLLTFVGFFPADAPRYSCIVCLQKTGSPASGGGMSGVVFHDIAEGVMAQCLKLDIKDAKDSHSFPYPTTKSGNMLSTDFVLNHLGFKTKDGWNGAYPFGAPIWGSAKLEQNTFNIEKNKENKKNIIPDVKGMGARDATFLLESKGIKVKVMGRGKVVRQSLAPGAFVKKNMVCHISLE